MSKFYAELEQKLVDEVEIFIPQTGIWYANVSMSEALLNTIGLKTLVVGDVEFKGTIIEFISGNFSYKYSYRIIGGYYGWKNTIKEKFYHNDAGVKLDNVLNDIARECKENLIELTLPSNRLESIYYVRKSQPASRTLSQLLSSPTQWWIDYSGDTHIGIRPINSIITQNYDVLSYSPQNRTCLLGAFDLNGFVPGAIIKSINSTEDFLIKSLHIKCSENIIRIKAEK